MAEKTALQKSHSKVSNFKLTMICFILALGFATLVVGLGLIKEYQTIGTVVTAAGGVATLLGLVLVNGFTRG